MGSCLFLSLCFHAVKSLVTQAMLQLRPNYTELRSMDLFNQILCRFQKYKQKVPPPSPLFGRKKPRLKVHVYGSNFFFSRNKFFPSSKQKLFIFLHIGSKFFFSQNKFFPSSKQKLFSFLHIGSKIFFSQNKFFPSSKQKLFSFLHIGSKIFFS